VNTQNENYSQVQQAPTATAQSLQIERLPNLMKSQSGMLLLGCFAAIAVFKFLSGSNYKGKVATSYWGSNREKSRAARKAKKQLSNLTPLHCVSYSTFSLCWKLEIVQ
jgi:hypothetical protein